MEGLFNISWSITKAKIPQKVTSTWSYIEDTQLERIFLPFSITMRPSPFCMTENNSWQTILEQMPAVSHSFNNSNSNSSVALYCVGFCSEWVGVFFLFAFFIFKIIFIFLFYFFLILKQAIWIGPHISQSFEEQTEGRLILLDPELVLVRNLTACAYIFTSTWTEWRYT